MRNDKVGIIVTQREWDLLLADKDHVGNGFFQGKTRRGLPFALMLSGVGKVNAAVTAYKLWREYYCTRLLSLGCATGSSLDVKIGDVIVGDEYMYYDVYCGGRNVVGQVQGCPVTFASDYERWKFLRGTRHGLIASGDTSVETEVMSVAVTRPLYPEHCPVVLDTESAAIAQVCQKRNVGFTSVRVVTDNPFSGERPSDESWKTCNDALFALFEKFLKEE